jgi:hypothetical protein
MTDPDVLHWDTFDQWIQTHYRPPEEADGGINWVPHRGRVGVAQIADITGIGRRRLYAWRKQGNLPSHVADLLAVSIGQHPSTIWRNWWNIAFDDEGAA